MEEFSDAMQELYGVLDLAIGTKDKLLAICDELEAVQKAVLDRGYLLDENAERLIELNDAHYTTMYHQGRELIGALPILNKLKMHIASLKGTLDAERESLRQTLWTELDALTVGNNVKVLMRSQSSFEKDVDGNPLALRNSEEGLRQFQDCLRRDSDRLFERDILPKIRNLQA